MTAFTGTAGNDNQNGTNNADTFDYSQGGNDTLSGKGGVDVFTMGAALTAADSIDGGNNNDVLILSGNYGGLIFGASTLKSIETLQLTAGNDYTLTLDNANVTIGQSMTIDASGLGAGDDFTFDGSDESLSPLTIICGAGINTVAGGGGDDIINGGANFNPDSTVYGGAGHDELRLNGAYASLDFNADTIHDVEKVVLTGGNNYNISMNDVAIELGDALTLDASDLTSSDALIATGTLLGLGRYCVLGGAGDDFISIGQSGEDIVRANGGDDTIFANADLTELSRIQGGLGTDVLHLTGDYSAGLRFLSGTIKGIETIALTALFDYSLASDNGNVGAGETLTIDASTFTAFDTAEFDGSDEKNGSFAFIGGIGTNVFTGGAEDDSFDVTLGGTCTLDGGKGDDIFAMAGTMTAADHIDGGGGDDTVGLNGNYAAPLDLTSDNLFNVETVTCAAGFNYSLNLNLAQPDQVIAVDASALGAGNVLELGFVTAGGLEAIGGAGDDVILGASETVGTYDLSHGGDDTVTVGGTSNIFLMGAAMTAADTLRGSFDSDSSDRVILDGDYFAGAGLVLGATTILQIEDVSLTFGHSYKITTNDANVAAGDLLSFSGQFLESGDVVLFDGSAETDGSLAVFSGAGADDIIGGGAHDFLNGGDGVDGLHGGGGDDTLGGGERTDIIEGGAGADTFLYLLVSESTGVQYDILVGANFDEDKFLSNFPVAAIDTMVIHGSLSTATFDADLAARIGASKLHAGNAVVYSPDAGTLAGHKFLIVDVNGVGGYQAGADLVIEVTGFTGTIDTGDFL